MSVTQPLCQSLSQSLNHYASQTVTQPVSCQSFNQYASHSHSTSMPVRQSLWFNHHASHSHSTSMPVTQPVCQSDSLSTTMPVRRSSQSVWHPAPFATGSPALQVNQWVCQSGSHSTRMPLSHPTSMIIILRHSTSMTLRQLLNQYDILHHRPLALQVNHNASHSTSMTSSSMILLFIYCWLI